MQRSLRIPSENFLDESSKKNEERIARRVRLMVPQIECADTHREIHRIEFIQPRRARKKIDCQTARKMSAALCKRVRIKPVLAGVSLFTWSADITRCVRIPQDLNDLAAGRSGMRYNQPP
jgi:hypothetical protein